MHYRHTPLNARAYFIVVLALLTVLVGALPAAAQDSGGSTYPPSEGTTWSDPEVFGDGQFETFVTQDADGNPSIIGITFPESTLANLPEGMGDGKFDVLGADGSVIFPCCGYSTVIPMPETTPATVFNHALVNWNPMGHPPAGVYDAPHFDLHFYTTSVEDREAIAAATGDTMCMVPNPPGTEAGEHPVPVTCETLQTATMPLPADQTPPGFISVGEVVPGMGDHLINPAAPELNGEKFTYTWLYGEYGGRLTFYEPMITLAFLQEKNPETCADIPMPKAMPEPGYYPTEYCIRYMPGDSEDNGTYAVTLEKFTEFK